MGFSRFAFRLLNEGGVIATRQNSRKLCQLYLFSVAQLKMQPSGNDGFVKDASASFRYTRRVSLI